MSQYGVGSSWTDPVRKNECSGGKMRWAGKNKYIGSVGDWNYSIIFWYDIYDKKYNRLRTSVVFLCVLGGLVQTHIEYTFFILFNKGLKVPLFNVFSEELYPVAEKLSGTRRLQRRVPLNLVIFGIFKFQSFLRRNHSTAHILTFPIFLCDTIFFYHTILMIYTFFDIPLGTFPYTLWTGG